MWATKWDVNRMPLIGRAWKVNVNVWKRHLTLQSVFNHGECMMHIDKNADGHVVDQNVDRILGDIAYVPLGERIRFIHAAFFFCFVFCFFGKEWVQDMLTSGHDKMRISVVILNFGHASQRSDVFEVLDVLPRGLMVWSLYVFPRGLMELPRGPIVWFWTCFLEVRWIWSLDVLRRGLMDLILDMLPRGPMDLKFGRTS